jgi:hypothetical protein
MPWSGLDHGTWRSHLELPSLTPHPTALSVELLAQAHLIREQVVLLYKKQC